MSANGSSVAQLLWQPPVCRSWKPDVEGAVYHLANCFLLMGFMAGSGVYGCFYLFGILGPGYLCCVLWGWFDACGLDIVLWNVLLTVACLLQLAQLVYRVRVNTLPEEFNLLYRTLCLPLQVPLQVYKEIVHCFGLRFDIRLPSLYHVLSPSASDGEPESEKDDEEALEAAVSPAQARPICIVPTPPCSAPPATTNFPVPLPRARMPRMPRPDSGNLGEDSTSLVLEDFEEVSGSESFMDYRSDGEYMR